MDENDPGWDDYFGPTNQALWEIYRKRLLDHELNEEYRQKMYVISTDRTRHLQLIFRANMLGDGTVEERGELVFSYEKLSFDLNFVSIGYINIFIDNLTIKNV